MVEEISSLLGDRDYSEKEALQELWLCFVAGQSWFFNKYISYIYIRIDSLCVP